MRNRCITGACRQSYCSILLRTSGKNEEGRERISTERSEYWADLSTGRRVSGVLSHSPSWPVHVPWIDDPHLDLVEYRDSPNDAEAEGNKQRDAACVARTDAGHEGLRPDAERVTRVGQEKHESRMCAALSTVRRLCKRPQSGVSFSAGGSEREKVGDGRVVEYAPAIITSHSTSNSGSSR